MNCPHCGELIPEMLTPTEQLCAKLRADGLTSKQIAAEVRMTSGNVKTRLMNVHRKLGIAHSDTHRRIYLARYWNCELFQIGLRELGLLPSIDTQSEVAA